MKGIIDLRKWMTHFFYPRRCPRFQKRVLRNQKRWRVVYVRWEEKPIVFYTAEVYLAKKLLLVMSNPWNEYWYPVITEDKVPLLIHDLIDRGFLEERHRDPKLWTAQWPEEG